MASSSPPTLTNAQTQGKFDVVLSFIGRDTRIGFISHLYAALSSKQINTLIDYQLVGGEEISASLLRIIGEAKISLVVFSENYASSIYCLEELAKSFECRKNTGQIVIPVFYKVDPSHVRNQKGSFGDLFARHVENKPLTMDKVQSFRDGLTDAANLAGWKLGESELETDFIEEIVGDVMKILFVIDVRGNKVESLLNMESQDVFLSFRGDDTREGFASHLYKALSRKQIRTFIDLKLVRGEEISASLMRRIEESKLSVVVFSEKYASSKWCLEELAKIIECRKNNGHIVIPVFYKVDPSHVRNQTGSFGDLFARHVENKRLTMDKVQSFRDALTGAANLSGWSSGESEFESEFIEKIVGDVLNKLHGLFGIDVRVNKVESLLKMESQDVLIVGIWGMGGIGKTTIAEALCSKVRSRFEGIFVANFRQELKTGSMADLQRSFLSQLLGQEILTMGSLSFRDTFVRDRLRRKKVFIILDDVDDLMPLEEWKELLHGRHGSFGPGSKVLMTSRDKQVLNNIVNETYEVERLSYEEALQLFSSKALKNCIPTIDQRDLMEKIASHVQGNPLALIVLGSSLCGKTTGEWCSALNKLAQNPL